MKCEPISIYLRGTIVAFRYSLRNGLYFLAFMLRFKKVESLPETSKIWIVGSKVQEVLLLYIDNSNKLMRNSVRYVIISISWSRRKCSTLLEGVGHVLRMDEVTMSNHQRSVESRARILTGNGRKLLSVWRGRRSGVDAEPMTNNKTNLIR